MLALEVELLGGVSVAASPHRREESEWPPHPDRLFQSLVAAWGREENPLDDERSALEWFERLDPDGLTILAPAASRRDVATVFVPPNDLPSVTLGAKRKERAFPAAVPLGTPVLHYVWQHANGVETHREALTRLVREVTYLGHSHCPVRVALVDLTAAAIEEMDGTRWVDDAMPSVRVPYPGRLSELTRRYAQGARPAPSLALHSFAHRKSEPPKTVFDDGFITVFGDAEGFVPALEAFPSVAKRLRDGLLALSPGDAPIPTLLSGHDGSGNRTRKPHLAIIPLADIGWRHSQGRLMGLAVVWPRGASDEDRSVALRALVAFVRSGSELHFGASGTWRIALAPASDRASLDVRRYIGPARRWATVLPAVLDRHPNNTPDQDVAAIVADACLNVGLPSNALEGMEIESAGYATVTGAPSSREVGGALPQRSPYRGRPLRHLMITFREPIRGPLLIGAGRFRGLGLCVALDASVVR